MTTFDRIIVTSNGDTCVITYPSHLDEEQATKIARTNITAADKEIRRIGPDKIRKIVITPDVINIVT